MWNRMCFGPTLCWRCVHQQVITCFACRTPPQKGPRFFPDSCSCPVGKHLCNGACATLATDTLNWCVMKAFFLRFSLGSLFASVSVHSGTCGNACASDQLCCNGQCISCLSDTKHWCVLVLLC